MRFAKSVIPNDTFVLQGPVKRWNLGDLANPRQWITVEIPFREFDHRFYVPQYKHKSEEWFEWSEFASHIRNLRKDMNADRFSPVPIVAGLLPFHMEHLQVRDGVATIDGTQHKRLPILDGSQRWMALRFEHEAAEKAGDTDRVAIIEGLDLTVVVYLECDEHRLKENLLNLQKGRPVDRNQIRAMEMDAGLLGPNNEVVEFATKACHLLNKDARSHLHGQIKFDSRSAQPIAYNSITTTAPSDIGTSICGGAKIAMEAGKSPEWLAERYVEAYRAILDHGRMYDDGDSRLLDRRASLCPTIRGGSRGATAMLIGIGNCHAWRMAYEWKKRPSVQDRCRIADVCDKLFLFLHTSWGGPDKRRHLGLFAREFFTDMIRSNSDAEGQGLKHYGGVPVALVEVLTASTFRIPREFLPSKASRRVSREGPSKIPSPLEGGERRTG
jgi:hypothetical protein